MAEVAGARALLEPRCVGTEGSEYLHVGFKSSDDYVLIVYAFMYALLNGYLLGTKVNVIIYARTGAPSGGRTHTGRILSPLPLPLGYRGHAKDHSLLAFLITESNMDSVNLPVKVFCWLGW